MLMFVGQPLRLFRAPRMPDKTTIEQLTGRGGPGRGQGDIPQRCKDVADERKYPRLDTYWDRSSGSCLGAAAPCGKRPRDGDAKADTPCKGEQDQSHLAQIVLGAGGLISQAVHSLKSGALIKHSFDIQQVLIFSTHAKMACPLLIVYDRFGINCIKCH